MEKYCLAAIISQVCCLSDSVWPAADSDKALTPITNIFVKHEKLKVHPLYFSTYSYRGNKNLLLSTQDFLVRVMTWYS